MPPCARRTPLPVLFGLLLIFAALNSSPAYSQSLPTAVRTIGLSVFAGGTYLHPDFGTAGDIGYLVGGDVTAHFRFFDASLEARYTSATGTYDDQHSFAGGLKLERAFHRFRPYGDFLVGVGGIKFDHPELVGADPNYTHDNSTIYDLGVGVDYRLTRRFSFKVDAQGQRWVIGKERPAFHPTNASVGIIYRIPYHSLRGR